MRKNDIILSIICDTYSITKTRMYFFPCYWHLKVASRLFAIILFVYWCWKCMRTTYNWGIHLQPYLKTLLVDSIINNK